MSAGQNHLNSSSSASIRVHLRLDHYLLRLFGILLSLLTTSCSQSAPLLSQETPRGKIQYSLHSPATPAKQRVILAHGFFRSPDTMDHLADSLAKDGIETACIKLKRSTPFNGNHDENARDLIALRESLGWTVSKPDPARTAAVHKSVLRESSSFLQSRPTSKP